MSSKKIAIAEKALKILVRQLSGQMKETDPIIPAAIIKGAGHIWAWDPFNKQMRQIDRGITVYILVEDYDSQNRALIYCSNADIICLDLEEIEEIGFN